MKRIFFLTGLFLLFLSCSQNNLDKCTLTGYFDNIKDGTVLDLFDIDSGKVCQRMVVQNGKFEIEFSLSEPRLYFINGESSEYNKETLTLWLENSKVSIKGKFDNISNASVKGSSANKIFVRYNSIERDFEQRSKNLAQTTSNRSSKIVRDSLIKASNEIVDHRRTDLIKFYSDHIKTEVAHYYLVKEITENKSLLIKGDIKKLYDGLTEKLRITKAGLFLKDYLSLPEIPKIGEKFIDFTLNDQTGKAVSIIDNLGKYTILEFWASWCGPCREEHKKMRRIYNQYHDKGLNIIGISGDENLKDWSDAIKIDSIPWINVSDLKGLQNKGFMLYGIKYVPQLILLDANGTIIDNRFDRNGIIVDNKIVDKDIESEINKIFKGLNGL